MFSRNPECSSEWEMERCTSHFTCHLQFFAYRNLRHMSDKVNIQGREELLLNDEDRIEWMLLFSFRPVSLVILNKNTLGSC